MRLAQETPKAEAKGTRTSLPIASTELPRGWSVRSTWGFATRNAGPICDIHPPKGGYQPPVTPGDGYELRLTPESFTDSDSHRPTTHKLRRNLRGEPHRSSDHPRPAVVFRRRANPHIETHTAVGWGDLPPGPKPTATSKGHAVNKNLAHGWRSCGYWTRLTPPWVEFERTSYCPNPVFWQCSYTGNQFARVHVYRTGSSWRHQILEVLGCYAVCVLTSIRRMCFVFNAPRSLQKSRLPGTLQESSKGEAPCPDGLCALRPYTLTRCQPRNLLFLQIGIASFLSTARLLRYHIWVYTCYMCKRNLKTHKMFKYGIFSNQSQKIS